MSNVPIPAALMELASAPLAKWQLIFSARISCIYKGKISNAPCSSCSSACEGEVSWPCQRHVCRVYQRAHGRARVVPGTARAWHCHAAAPGARGTTATFRVMTSWALLHRWHPGILGGQGGEEASSMCSQLSWPFGHHFASQWPVQPATFVLV